MRARGAGAALLALAGATCGAPPAITMPPPVAEVIARHQDSLLAIPGVAGIGEGARDGTPTIVIMIERRTAELERRLPRTLDGYRVDLLESGTITAQDSAP